MTEGCTLKSQQVYCGYACESKLPPPPPLSLFPQLQLKINKLHPSYFIWKLLYSVYLRILIIL